MTRQPKLNHQLEAEAKLYGDSYFAASLGLDYPVIDGPRAEVARTAYDDAHSEMAKANELDGRSANFGIAGELITGVPRKTWEALHGGRIANITASIAAMATVATASVYLTTGSANPEHKPTHQPAVATNEGEIQRPMLSDMAVGQRGYMLGWEYYGQDGKVYVLTDSPWSPVEKGTYEIPVEREKDGYHIEPNKNYPVRQDPTASNDDRAPAIVIAHL
jgi:hypothetical protein